MDESKLRDEEEREFAIDAGYAPVPEDGTDWNPLTWEHRCSDGVGGCTAIRFDLPPKIVAALAERTAEIERRGHIIGEIGANNLELRAEIERLREAGGNA